MAAGTWRVSRRSRRNSRLFSRAIDSQALEGHILACRPHPVFHHMSYTQADNMFHRIKDWLSSNSIDFQELHHRPTKTSEETARARGEDLSIGDKVLILKIDELFVLHVLSASNRIDSSAIKKHFNSKKVRFANKDELMDIKRTELCFLSVYMGNVS